MGVISGAQVRVRLDDALNELVADYIADREGDQSLAALLAQAEDPHQPDSTRLVDALNRFRSQVYAAREYVLYPDQASNAAPSLALCYLSSQRGGFSPNGWRSLTSDGGHLALHLFQSFASSHSEDADLRRLLADRALAGLRLMLLARMYGVRAEINGLPEVPAITDGRNRYQDVQDVLEGFDLAFKQYRAQVRSWQLEEVLRHGELIEGDAAAVDAWSREFGQARDQEYGWNQFARTVGKELRYRRDKLGMRLRWLEVLHRREPDSVPLAHIGRLRYRGKRLISAIPVRLANLAWALATTAFMIAGFGRKPGRFALNVALTILAFSVLYFGDEYLVTHCAGQPTLRNYGHALYLAVANFTNVGAAVCGPFQGALVSVESLMGFFLLSVLAAMLFVWLTDR